MVTKPWLSFGGLARLALASGLIALAAGALPGCIIVAHDHERVIVSGSPIEQDKLDQITLGTTTEDQVRALLGSPASRVMGENGRQVWTYRDSESGRNVIYINDDDDEIRTDALGKVTIELTDGVATAVRRE